MPYRTPTPQADARLAARIEAILAEPEGDDDDAPSRAERIDSVYQPEDAWPRVEMILMDILEDPSRSLEDHLSVADVFWGALLEREPITRPNRLIALVYARLPPDEGSSENNLAWSITMKLKKKSYTSSYDPLEDPEVRRELETVAKERGS